MANVASKKERENGLEKEQHAHGGCADAAKQDDILDLILCLRYKPELRLSPMAFMMYSSP